MTGMRTAGWAVSAISTISTISTVGLVALFGSGCSAREDDGYEATADELVTTDVNACREGESLPMPPTDAFYWDNYDSGLAVYDADKGVTVNVGDFFNPSEFGYFALAMTPEGESYAKLYFTAEALGACRGTISVLPHARILVGEVESEDPAADVLARFCVPDTNDGESCELQTGRRVFLGVPPLAQLHGFVRVNAAPVHFRSSPNTTGASYEVMPIGTILKLTGSAENDFLSMERNGKQGWVHKDYAWAFPGSAVTTAGLNLRQSASVLAPVKRVIPAGARVTLLGWGEGQFAYVRYNGEEGMASGQFLKDPTYDESME